MRLNLGIRRRLAALFDGDWRRIELLYSILFTLPGSPILYYGDEIGMGDNIWLDDRDGVRTPMQWEAGPNGGFSCGGIPLKCLYTPLIDDERFGYRIVNVASQRADQGSLWHTLRRMIAVRKGQHALGDGGCEFLPVVNPAGLALVRTNGGETILALHNLSALPQAIALDLSRWQEATVGNLLSARRFPTVGDRPYLVTFRPYEYLWLKL